MLFDYSHVLIQTESRELELDLIWALYASEKDSAMRLSPITVITVVAGVFGTFRRGMSLLIDTTCVPPVQSKGQVFKEDFSCGLQTFSLHIQCL